MRISWPWLLAGASATVATYALFELRKIQRHCHALHKPVASATHQRKLEDAPGTAISESASHSHHQRSLLAGVELGGTTCVAALAYADDPTNILEKTVVKTRQPHETLSDLCRWLDKRPNFKAIGIAAFGPIDLDPSSQTYGFVTTTPKEHWANYNLLQHFSSYHVPIALDTDVNAPALAEYSHGNHARDSTSCAYVTVGTGIGVGVVVNGEPVHGLMHPEGGHVTPERHPRDTYSGWSVIHRSSVESLASAQACAERCGVSMDKLPEVSDDDPSWDVVAYYLAQLCYTVTLILSPHFIVLSGGVMQRLSLFPLIRNHFAALNNGYINVPKIRESIDTYIVPSAFGSNSGVIGAIELARRKQHN